MFKICFGGVKRKNNHGLVFLGIEYIPVEIGNDIARKAVFRTINSLILPKCFLGVIHCPSVHKHIGYRKNSHYRFKNTRCNT